MSNKTVLITGGSGMIGSALTKSLTQHGYDVIVLSRNPLKAKARQKTDDRVSFAHWDVKKDTIDDTAIAAAHVIVHLAGAGVVDKAWTTAYKKEIVDSRTRSSELIIKSLKRTPNKVHTLVSASGIGWYGEDTRNSRPFVETDPHADEFLAETCYLWEESVKPVKQMGIRLATFRFGLVLSKSGGALSEFLKPLQARVAGILGSGKQMISWIHIHDLCRLIVEAIEKPTFDGVFNAVAPVPVSNKEMMITLAHALYGNAFLAMPVPAFVLKTMLGERSREVLKSATVSSALVQDMGFRFHFPHVKQALENIVREKAG